ncbi:DUF4167 domain-containing protein [Azospirillum halopraeferens]|uniref:DUF4167 domain-containing protein n=1 Tax=Azospirillum halopraeferens TaxID=34010 RepID=UPI00041B4152
MRHQTFDSNGPDVRIRGNAWQVHEKYQALARDAASSGDRIMAENYLQHAEHYFRIINQIQEAENRQRDNRAGGNNNGNGHDRPGADARGDDDQDGDETSESADERAQVNA